eukprot:2891358-Pyramimonas_sp.AAC.1
MDHDTLARLLPDSIHELVDDFAVAWGTLLNCQLTSALRTGPVCPERHPIAPSTARIWVLSASVVANSFWFSP